jgi:CubicO group peptidase (beta-lactamase class C family)
MRPIKGSQIGDVCRRNDFGWLQIRLLRTTTNNRNGKDAMSMLTSARVRVFVVLLCLAATSLLGAQQPPLEARLAGLDAYMAQVLKDWNVPGIGVGVVVKDKLVFAKGYGYRDYGKRLPFTPATTQPIASNTKLFTAMAAGLLVDEGKLDWDKPIRQYVTGI